MVVQGDPPSPNLYGSASMKKCSQSEGLSHQENHKASLRAKIEVPVNELDILRRGANPQQKKRSQVTMKPKDTPIHYLTPLHLSSMVLTSDLFLLAL
jgi:hypothetical protein